MYEYTRIYNDYNGEGTHALYYMQEEQTVKCSTDIILSLLYSSFFWFASSYNIIIIHDDYDDVP